MQYLVPQQNKGVQWNSAFLVLIATLAIYSVVIPVMLIDLWVGIYQYIYFGIMKIPRIKRSEYVIFDRVYLPKLSIMQRINCLYCEYVNGVFAWIKEVAAQTEIYSCAIKHSTTLKGREHHRDFYQNSDFSE